MARSCRQLHTCASPYHACTLCLIYSPFKHSKPTHSCYMTLCAGGNSTAFLNDFQRSMEEASILAAARLAAFVDVITDEDGNCEVDIGISEACAETTLCAVAETNCRGPGINGLIPCCEADYVCTRKDSIISRCLLKGASLHSIFEGTIEQVPVIEQVPSCRPTSR